MMHETVPIESLVGLTMVSVTDMGGDALVMVATDGRQFKFCHDQSCCESVTIESIVGDLSDLVGEPITLAEERTGDTPADYSFGEYEPSSYTWTFYTFATRKGYVDVRWLGTSNGYYGEGVSLYELRD